MALSLFIAPSKLASAGDRCVYLQAGSLGRYSAFWTFDQNEADLYLTKASARAEELGDLWQSRQFTLLDNVLQEIENETLKELRLTPPATRSDAS